MSGCGRWGSRFWVATGTDIKGGIFAGISVEVNNMKALLAGGVAFATPDDGDARPVPEGADYTLHDQADKDWLACSGRSISNRKTISARRRATR